MVINDEIIKKEFNSNRYIYDPTKCRWYINKIEGKYDKKIYEYLTNRYSDSSSLKETLYRIFNNIEVRPVCNICGNKLKFDNGFKKFCSNRCAQLSNESKEKRKKTCLERYGVDNYSKTSEYKQRIKSTCLERYGVEYSWQSKECKEKIKETCLERYGVDSPQKSKSIKEKSKETCLERYGVDNPAKSNDIKEKTKQTCIERYGKISTTQVDSIRKKIVNSCLKRYGVDNPAKSNDIKEKTKQTCIERYGGISPLSSKEIQDKYINTCISKYGVTNFSKTNKFKYTLSYLMSSEEMQCHRYEIMKLHNTFNISKPEEELYLYIKEKFPEVKRQYKDKKRYPFCCDFYIPSLDYFIEFNNHWTHGKHPYVSNSIKDQEKIENWKSKHTKYYDNALDTWTERDVKKRETAKNNNLNFKEIWTLEEGKKFIDELTSVETEV